MSRDRKALRLSFDHKPYHPSELKRINSVGGTVTDNRTCGVLAVSRAIGDWSLHPSVISDPYYRETELQPGDEFIVMGCDGVWDVVGDDEAVAIVTMGREKGYTAQDCANLVRDISLQNGSTDNVSVIVVFLQDTVLDT
eukprot:TRINITY_DN1597_c0_g1_i2.p1 TRINITY_DN1597_c0_g1~~TRINITY_DN1597_c0_g1_i2.p1  ORF type:complete len:139 (-),score=18.38 TRINITY_DN1597_c0_g1_i2:25-441(-)